MSFLPEPKLLDIPSIDEAVLRIQKGFLKKYPDTAFDKNSPLYELSCQFAYEEVLLLSKINELSGGLLNRLKEIYEDKRLAAGERAYYAKKTAEFEETEDIEVIAAENGWINIYVKLVEKKETSAADRLIKLQDNLNRPDIRLLSDRLKVCEAIKQPFSIKASITFTQNTQVDADTLKEKLKISLKDHLKLGKGLSRNFLVHKFFAPDVLDVKIDEPSEDLPALGGHYPEPTKIEVNIVWK